MIGFGELSAQKIVNMLKEEYQKSISGSKEEELLAKLEASKIPKRSGKSSMPRITASS